MARDRRLAEYQSKRDSRASGEPAGSRPARRARGNRFVIHRHDASSLHFDFRLEVDGVLVSWAVPKGPSTDPREKRLATRTEDHPIEYIDFEGRIEEGNYGAGTVIVWDTGTYRNLSEHDGDEVPMGDAVAGGHAKVWLDGQKLRGGYALTRTAMRGDQRNWLLVKVNDSEADRRRRPVTTEPESVLSGRTNEDLDRP
ncbi:MAG TPA: DNA polymerase ligase N-terminal domain-containing protein [Pseudonocardiaceae bacterium]|nr:DNA polymerase ligase N-terminal domain-containing protein [Pseudonocardiaceae bacterium]